MPQPQPQLKNRKKRAKLARAGILALAAACAAAAISASPQRARAIVVPRTVSPSALPEPVRDANDVPAASSLFFILDDTISSRGQSGTAARAHLRDAIVVGGITVAPAGSPVWIRIIHAKGAEMANVDGYVDIYFDSLALANGGTLPLVTPTSHIDPHLTASQANTQAVTDTVGDIFIPYHFLYHMLRKGMEVELRPGTVVRARTAAEIKAQAGKVAIIMPPAIAGAGDAPRPPFKVAPVATPPGFATPTPKPSPSAQPSAQPTAQPT